MHDVDLVLLDVGMPGLTGLEVVTRIRRRPPTATVPVVLVTGFRQSCGRGPRSRGRRRRFRRQARPFRGAARPGARPDAQPAGMGDGHRGRARVARRRHISARSTDPRERARGDGGGHVARPRSSDASGPGAGARRDRWPSAPDTRRVSPGGRSDAGRAGDPGGLGAPPARAGARRAVDRGAAGRGARYRLESQPPETAGEHGWCTHLRRWRDGRSAVDGGVADRQGAGCADGASTAAGSGHRLRWHPLRGYGPVAGGSWSCGGDARGTQRDTQRPRLSHGLSADRAHRLGTGIGV